MTTTSTAPADLRRDPLAAIRAIDFRATSRDFWRDEAAIWDRFLASWAGLDDAAWALPGAAPSDAGGPDWSLAEHVGHIVDWHEMAAVYVERVLDGGAWPSDDDYDGGDFDHYNERRRQPWADLHPAALRARLASAHDDVLAVARRVPAATIRSDEAWGWVYQVLHGHAIDHLVVIEPWAARLRQRQVEGDPFLDDPRPAGDGSTRGGRPVLGGRTLRLRAVRRAGPAGPARPLGGDRPAPTGRSRTTWPTSCAGSRKAPT